MAKWRVVIEMEIEAEDIKSAEEWRIDQIEKIWSADTKGTMLRVTYPPVKSICKTAHLPSTFNPLTHVDPVMVRYLSPGASGKGDPEKLKNTELKSVAKSIVDLLPITLTQKAVVDMIKEQAKESGEEVLDYARKLKRNFEEAKV